VAVGMPRDSSRSLYHSTNDTIGLLKFESDTASQVIIRKLDMQGDYAGTTAIDTGTRQGPVMSGIYLTIIPGQPSPIQGTWRAKMTQRECTLASGAAHPDVSYFDVGMMDLLLGDEKPAVHCWEVGDGKAEPQSEDMLSRAYYNGGPYTPKNLKESLRYSESAATNGDLGMMHNTAEMYRLGEGAPVDHFRAGFWNDVEVCGSRSFGMRRR
jgi:hypothetical protein